MEITTIGVIDPTNELLPLLKQHLTRNFKFAYASDFVNAAEIFQSPVLVIIHWPRIAASHLQNIFRQETGYSCKQLLNGLKAYYSTWLMQQTSFSFNEISTRIGLVSAKNFHRFFKNITGISPGEYREKYQSTDFPALFRESQKKIKKD